MPTKRNLPQPKPQDRPKHPAPVEEALNPAAKVVRTSGTPGATEPRARPASELKRMVRALRTFAMDELKQIPVIEEGARLRPGAVYLDLAGSQRRAFVARDESFASEGSLCVAKATVPEPLWNRLLRAHERTPPASSRRYLEQGENQPRGGRERSERRGAGPVGRVRAPARHPGARGH